VIETEREGFTALLVELKYAQQVASVDDLATPSSLERDIIHIWDEIVNEPLPAGPDTPQVPVPGPATILPDSPTGPLPIEEQPISLPSNGNVPAIYHELELSHRISHADHHLNRIQDLIAEKSFQYSHVIHVAPRKAVNTHSRAAVKKLNLEIALHCRLYSQCQTWLL